jgi:hypothetical protein
MSNITSLDSRMQTGGGVSGSTSSATAGPEAPELVVFVFGTGSGSYVVKVTLMVLILRFWFWC